MYSVIGQLKDGLIVSCQAGPESALHGPVFMSAMAREAERGGASGLRIDGVADIAAVRSVTQLPIIGINKHKFPGYDSYITITYELAQQVVAAGANLVAMDGTGRPLPRGVTLKQLIGRIHTELNVPVMADVSTLAEGVAAINAGADIVATTMSGYTPNSRPAIPYTPDFDLLRELAALAAVPVVVEGRVSTPEQMAQCFVLGAHAVCIGGAITSPAGITERFVKMIRGGD